MAQVQNFCQVLTEIPAYLDVKVSIPTGVTLTAGKIIKAETMDTTIYGNYQTYGAEVPALTDELVIMLDGGFETMADGRRPDGQPDFTQYEFVGGKGDVYTGLRLTDYVHYQISVDAINLNALTPTVGQFLTPDGTTNTLKLVATKPADVKQYLEIKALKNIQTGGNFGTGLIQGLVCMARSNAVPTTI